MAGQELLRVQRLITAMAHELATRLSRRKKAGVKAHGIDPGRTMRRSLRYGGEVMELVVVAPSWARRKWWCCVMLVAQWTSIPRSSFNS